jgi:hypothetical protein
MHSLKLEVTCLHPRASSPNLQTYVKSAGGKHTPEATLIYFQHCTSLRRCATLLVELVAQHVVGVASSDPAYMAPL